MARLMDSLVSCVRAGGWPGIVATCLFAAGCDGSSTTQGATEGNADTQRDEGEPGATRGGSNISAGFDSGDTEAPGTSGEEATTFGQAESSGDDGGCGECPEQDGDLCTVPTCVAGRCTEVENTCEHDDNACAIASCNASTGACEFVANDDVCTTAGMCQTPFCAIDRDGSGAFVSAQCDTIELSNVACDDGDPCTMNDTCDLGNCAGDGLVCTDVPADTCDDATHLRLYTGEGACSEGACGYASNVLACPDGCAGAACVAPSHPVISEVLYDTAGVDEGEFIELWVPAGYDLTGHTVTGVNGVGGAVYTTDSLDGVTVDDDGLVLLVQANASAELLAMADVITTRAYQNGPDSIVLSGPGGVIDALAYGNFAATEIAAGEGSPAPDAGPDTSLARRMTWFDSNDNATDFVVSDTPTPGAMNP